MSTTAEKRAKDFFRERLREFPYPTTDYEMIAMLEAYEESFKKLLAANLAAYEHIINSI
jgi:hypothetical protein